MQNFPAQGLNPCPLHWKGGVFTTGPPQKSCEHTSKIMLKILQARLQQYVNHELPDVQAGFRKGRGTRDQIANIQTMNFQMFRLVLEKAEEPGIKLPTFTGSSKKQESYRKPSTSALLIMPLTVWITTNWKILKEMGIPDHLTCLLRNLYAGQEATIRTGHGTTDLFQIGKGVLQGCILSPCLFNLYAENIMRNAGLEEAQAGIRIARRNIHNLRYADDTTLMAESEEELKPLDESESGE